MLKQADTLVHVAEINANSAFTPLLKKFSFLRESRCKTLGFHPDDCGRVRENRQRKLMGKVGAKLIQRHPSNGRHGFEDCAAFYERSLNAFASEDDDPRFVASDPLGFWVVWNVLGRPLESEEERRLVRTIGGMIHYTFLNWWKGST